MAALAPKASRIYVSKMKIHSSPGTTPAHREQNRRSRGELFVVAPIKNESLTGFMEVQEPLPEFIGIQDSSRAHPVALRRAELRRRPEADVSDQIPDRSSLRITILSFGKPSRKSRDSTDRLIRSKNIAQTLLFPRKAKGHMTQWRTTLKI